LALFDRVQFTTATTGTGTITVGTASSGYQTPADAGISNGATFPYVIVDGTDWETGTGTYTVSGTTVARVLADSSTGSLLNLSGAAIMFITPLASTTPQLNLAQTFTLAQTFAAAINLTSGQITFPASQSASADVNTLDDYEEGSWTPALKFGGNSSGLTYSLQHGSYTKIGRQVTVDVALTLSAKGSSTGTATITGLPFAAGSGNAVYIGATMIGALTSATDGRAFIQAGGSSIGLNNYASGTWAVLTSTNFQNTTQVYITMTYFT
jgi:hypothetical protein